MALHSLENRNVKIIGYCELVMHVWLIWNTIQIAQYVKKGLERQLGTSEVGVMKYFHCLD